MTVRHARGWRSNRWVAFTLLTVWFAVSAAAPAGSLVQGSLAGAGQDAADELSGAATVSQVPTALTLTPGDTAPIVVEVENPTAYEVVLSSVDVVHPSTVEVDVQAVPETVPPGQSVTFSYDVVARSGKARIVTVVTLSEPAGPDGAMVDRVVEVASDLETVSAAPTIELVALNAPASVADGEADIPVSVLVRNPSIYAFENATMTTIDSNDLVLERPSSGDCATPESDGAMTSDEPFDVAAGSAAIVELCLDVEGVVRIGKQTVAAVVSGTFATPGTATPATASSPMAIDVTVLGVSALSPLGAAGLLLFPAIVPVVVFLGFARVVYPRSSWLPSKVDVSEVGVGVWLVALAAAIYAIVWLVTGTDFTRETDTRSIVILYGLGMALGLVAWGAFALGYSRSTGRKRYKPGDSPKKVIERLAAQGASLSRPTVKGATPKKYILGRGPQGEVAVCSRLRYNTEPDIDDSVLSSFVQAIDGGDSGKALKELEKLSGRVTLDWSSGGVELSEAVEPDTAHTVIGPQ